MKLFYKPGACSLASHIVLYETGASFSIEQVDTDSQRTAGGDDYRAVNPNGYVPALRLGDGQVITEGAAVLQYIADSHPAAGLSPGNGTVQRARLHESLNFLASELHKAFGPFFTGLTLTEQDHAAAQSRLFSRLDHVQTRLADGRPFLLGPDFSVADAYLFAVGRWVGALGLDYARWPSLAALIDRVGARPSARSAMQAEGLLN